MPPVAQPVTSLGDVPAIRWALVGIDDAIADPELEECRAGASTFICAQK